MSSLADLPEIVGFFSYSREDDEAFKGTLSALRNAIQRELSAQLGRSKKTFRLWQDQVAIAPGKMWESEIKKAVGQSFFFIPIVTPRSINSKYCKFEFDIFLAREKELCRNDLIFPILYISVAALQDEAKWRDDPVLLIIGQRQYVDWRLLRHLDIETSKVRVEIEHFCEKLVEALNEPWTSPEERRRMEEAKRRAEEERRKEQRAESETKTEAEARRKAAEEVEARRKTEKEEQKEKREPPSPLLSRYAPAFALPEGIRRQFIERPASESEQQPNSAEQDDAINAARTILVTIGQRDYEKLWEKSADWYKQKTGIQKSSFVAGWALNNRQMFGPLKSSSVIDATSTENDPSGFRGKIYTVTFLNSYTFGNFYERVFLIKENGQFKLINFIPAPAQ